MESLATIESFVQSAQEGSFSAAARKLGVTPAAISKNVAALEGRLGVRLFQRSTRRLKLTEPGERFLQDAASGLANLQAAMENVRGARSEPSGKLRVSVPVAFGRDYVLPVLPAFMKAHPAVDVEISLDNRQVDLVGEGFDVGIGGSLDLGAGIITRELGRAHIVAVASPDYIARCGTPRTPAELREHDGILLRSAVTGRIRSFVLRHGNEEAALSTRQRLVFDDMEAVCSAARLGLGVGMIATIFAFKYIESGELVRVLPKWYADGGGLLIYYASQKLLPAKTRAFVDFVVAHFKRERIAARVRAD